MLHDMSKMRDLTVSLDRETCFIFDIADSPSKMPAHDTRHGFISVSPMLCGFFAFATSKETAYAACTIAFDSV
jgi:hypothetical protein